MAIKTGKTTTETTVASEEAKLAQFVYIKNNKPVTNLTLTKLASATKKDKRVFLEQAEEWLGVETNNNKILETLVTVIASISLGLYKGLELDQTLTKDTVSNTLIAANTAVELSEDVDMTTVTMSTVSKLIVITDDINSKILDKMTELGVKPEECSANMYSDILNSIIGDIILETISGEDKTVAAKTTEKDSTETAAETINAIGAETIDVITQSEQEAVDAITSTVTPNSMGSSSDSDTNWLAIGATVAVVGTAAYFGYKHFIAPDISSDVLLGDDIVGHATTTGF